MSSSRDYYKSSRDPSRDALPPIRDVLGDQLDFPPRRDNAYSFDAVQRALPDASGSRPRGAWPQSGPTLPPIHNSRTQGYTTTPPTPLPYSRPPHAYPHPQHPPSSHPQHPPSTRPQHPPTSHSRHPPAQPPSAPYSFDVFRPSSAGLVHASSSHRSQGILRTTRADAGRKSSHQTPADDDDDDDDANKKYVCNHCGKRFGRPSSLKTHQVVHSDEKPYKCPNPGCNKTFSVASNMRRHQRKAHDAAATAAVSGSAGSADDEDEDYYYPSASGSGTAGAARGRGGGYGDEAYMPSSSPSFASGPAGVAGGSGLASGSGSKGYYTSSKR